jgi:hypothetical protein
MMRLGSRLGCSQASFGSLASNPDTIILSQKNTIILSQVLVHSLPIPLFPSRLLNELSTTRQQRPPPSTLISCSCNAGAMQAARESAARKSGAGTGGIRRRRDGAQRAVQPAPLPHRAGSAGPGRTVGHEAGRGPSCGQAWRCTFPESPDVCGQGWGRTWGLLTTQQRQAFCLVEMGSTHQYHTGPSTGSRRRVGACPHSSVWRLSRTSSRTVTLLLERSWAGAWPVGEAVFSIIRISVVVVILLLGSSRSEHLEGVGYGSSAKSQWKRSLTLVVGGSSTLDCGCQAEQSSEGRC